MLPKNSKIGVIGAGVSGLSYCYFLSKLRPDLNIILYEKSRRTGGWINSEKVSIGNIPVILEKGPRTLRISDGTYMILDILKDLKSLDQANFLAMDDKVNTKYILHHHRLVQVPNNFWSFLKFIRNPITDKMIGGIMMEPFKRKTELEDDTIENFFRRRLNVCLSDNIVSAIIHGIYAGDVAKLSVKSIFPSLFQMEKDHGSLIRAMFSAKKSVKKDQLERYDQLFGSKTGQFKTLTKGKNILSLTNGLQTLTDVMTTHLEKKIEIRYDSQIESIGFEEGKMSVDGELFDSVYSTISSKRLSGLLKGFEEISTKLDEIKYSTILLCNVYIKGRYLKYDGFGYLVPKSENKDLLGVIFDSNVEGYDQQKDYTKLTLMIGGYKDVESSEKYVLDNLRGVLHTLDIPLTKFKFSEPDSLKEDEIYLDYKVVSDCIPQFEVGYEEWKDEMRGLLDGAFHGKLRMDGMNSLQMNGVGVPDNVLKGYLSAREISGSEVVSE